MTECIHDFQPVVIDEGIALGAWRCLKCDMIETTEQQVMREMDEDAKKVNEYIFEAFLWSIYVIGFIVVIVVLYDWIFN